VHTAIRVMLSIGSVHTASHVCIVWYDGNVPIIRGFDSPTVRYRVRTIGRPSVRVRVRLGLGLRLGLHYRTLRLTNPWIVDV